MAHTKLDKQVISDITKYRAICLLHRYFYYVKAAPLISDLQYDTYEHKLKGLVTQHPSLAFEADNFSYCPTEHVGSDNPEDYPRRIEQLAEDILAHKGDHGKSEVSDMPVVPIPSIT